MPTSPITIRPLPTPSHQIPESINTQPTESTSPLSTKPLPQPKSKSKKRDLMTSDNSHYVPASLRGNIYTNEVPPSVYVSQSLRGAHPEKNLHVDYLEQLFNVKPTTLTNQDKDSRMMLKSSLPEISTATKPLPVKPKDLTKRNLPTPPKGNTPPKATLLPESPTKPFFNTIAESNCPNCLQAFSKSRRRFVCRICNLLYCINCTNRVMGSLLLNEDTNELVRVCNPCYSTISGSFT